MIHGWCQELFVKCTEILKDIDFAHILSDDNMHKFSDCICMIFILFFSQTTTGDPLDGRGLFIHFSCMILKNLHPLFSGIVTGLLIRKEILLFPFSKFCANLCLISCILFFKFFFQYICFFLLIKKKLYDFWPCFFDSLFIFQCCS